MQNSKIFLCVTSVHYPIPVPPLAEPATIFTIPHSTAPPNMKRPPDQPKVPSFTQQSARGQQSIWLTRHYMPSSATRYPLPSSPKLLANFQDSCSCVPFW